MENREITERTSELEARVTALEQVVRMLLLSSPSETQERARSMLSELSEVLPAQAVSERTLQTLQRSIYEVALRKPGERDGT